MRTSTSFADRIINIAVTGAMVRIELGAMQLPATKEQKPQLVPTQTLVMPRDGFVASLGMMESVMKQLVKDGVINLQPKAKQAAVPK
jgi:hypothetical protein